jgi:hypothetical protein
MLCQESHKVLVLEQRVLLDDTDIGLGLAQLVQLGQQEVAHLQPQPHPPDIMCRHIMCRHMCRPAMLGSHFTAIVHLMHIVYALTFTPF